MSIRNILARYVLFIFGLYVMAVGVVLIVKCSLGTTPIASLNYVLSLNTSFSLGIWTFIFNLVLIIAQLVLLGKISLRKISWRFYCRFLSRLFFHFSLTSICFYLRN